jgi:uncharacterized protein YndB with AHSA1/START domain
MQQKIKPAPVRKSVRVNAPPEHAFDVFVRRIGAWWPKSHHIGATDPETFVIEPRQGGRWFERGTDGAECEIGKVLAWEPPKRLLLAWQITADWKYDAALVTEVEVRFVREGDATRVELEHRNLERLGDRAEGYRQQIDSPNGWSMILQLFSATAEHAQRRAP